MSLGLDCFSNCTNMASTLKSKGYDFICRYYNVNNASKNLTQSEAKALSNAGLYIVAIWENGYPTSDSYFSKSQGKTDGAKAYSYAKNTIGQPSGTPIYFAVDYDASTSAIQGAIKNYFDGVSEAFEEAGSNYVIGVYGSGAVCEYIFGHVAAVLYTWLANATGWSGYSDYTSWHIKQGSLITINNVQFDKDTGSGDAGGFKI